MKHLFILLLFISISSFGQVVLVQDSFNTITPKYADVSKTYLWGSNTIATSAFKVSLIADSSGQQFNAIHLSDTALKYPGYVAANSLKAGNCIDYYWTPLDRSQDTITVEFDAMWTDLNNGGQDSRIVIALMHKASKLPPFGALTDSLAAIEPYGRPAYSFRILNRTQQGSNNYANMMYGGGKDTLGEFEMVKDSGVPKWWLPGFISGPGGITPEGLGVYPNDPVTRYRTKSLASNKHWHHFKWVVYPNELKVFFKRTKDPDSAYEQVMFLRNPNFGTVPDILADLNTAHGTSATKLPTLYNWFNGISGLRIFQNNGKLNYLTNVKVSFSGSVTSLVKTTTESLGVKLYPNPTQNSFMLQFEDNFSAKTIELYGLNGQKIISEIHSGDLVSMNIEHLSNGMYLVRVLDEDGKLLATEKLIKN